MTDVVDAEVSEVIKSDVALPREAFLLTPAERKLAELEAVTVDSPAMYDIVAGEVATIKGAYSRLEGERMDLTRPLDEVKRKIMDRFRRPLELLKRGEELGKAKLLSYRGECERKADEERRAGEDAARVERERLEREAAERERVARDEAAERHRLAAAEAEDAKCLSDAQANELAAKGRAHEAEALRIKSDEDARAKAEETRRATADLFEHAEAEAEALRATAAVVVAPPPRTEVPATKGTSVRRKWKARVVNLGKLIRFVAANPQYEALLIANEQALNAQANSLQGRLLIDGVEAFEDRTLASGSRQ